MKLHLVFYTILFCCFTTSVTLAKKAPKPSYIDQFKNHYLNTKFADADFNNYTLTINPTYRQNAINTFLQKNRPGLFDGNRTVKAINSRQTPNARYYQYKQYYNNVAVYNSGITVALNKNNKVFSGVYNTFNYSDKELKLNQPLQADSKIINQYFANTNDSIVVKKIDVAVFINNENALPQYVYVVDFKNFTQNWYHQIVLSRDLALLYAKDLRSYFKEGTETSATTKVFNPDPLTTAGKPYGFEEVYIDNDDANSSFLNDQRFEVEIPVCLTDAGTYVLNSEFISIQDIEYPNIEPPVFDNDNLCFERMAPEFENVNAVYHIHNYNKYLISIGCKDLVRHITIDAHAVNGDDQSYFEPDRENPALLFGEGGVDDAEDADVIIHEYGHGISFFAAPLTNNGNQRQAIDEGFGDFIAASYSRSINEFGWERVFSWDGHNEFWPGRHADTDKTYPDGLISYIHEDGEIWCRSLVDIEAAIGRDRTHKILLESMYGYQSNLGMVEAAKLFIEADSLLFGGENYFEIWKAFHNRGFLEFEVFAGEDTIVCKGDEIRIGAENFLLTNNEVNWTPTQNINDPAELKPLVKPDTSTLYTLTVTVDDESYSDEIFVQVDTCNSTEIYLANTYSYIDGNHIIFNLPQVNIQNLRISLFNNNGQAFNFEPLQLNESNYKANISHLAKGVYFLRLVDKKLNHKTIKFLKI